MTSPTARFALFDQSWCAAGVSPRRARAAAFTLVEMLVVIGIIALLLVAVIPAVNSISKSSGRKAAVTSLLGAIEQARAQAIKDGQATYLIFPTFSSGPPATLTRYNYKAYAIFEEDAADPTTPTQLSSWSLLPVGVSLRADSSSGQALSNLPSATSDFDPPLVLAFAPDRTSAPVFRCIKFNPDGAIELPAANVVLAVFEGFVSGSTEVLTSKAMITDSITVSHLTGRAAHDS